MNQCPITGEPITPPDTVSRTAVNQLKTTVRDLPELMAYANYAMTGLKHGNDMWGLHHHESKEPLNLNLLEQITQTQTTINDWAYRFAVHTHVNHQKNNWQQAKALFSIFPDPLRRWTHAPELIDNIKQAINHLEWIASPTAREHPRDTYDAHNEFTHAILTAWLPRKLTSDAIFYILGEDVPPQNISTWATLGKIRRDQTGKFNVADAIRYTMHTRGITNEKLQARLNH